MLRYREDRMFSSYLWIILPILWNGSLGYKDVGCPPEESIAPHCICKNLGNGPMMLCSNIMNAEELISPIKTTDSYDMFSLGIIDSSLMYIPSKLFIDTNYAKIRFANTQLMALSDTDLAFEGLEDTLEEIRASGAHYITTWDWSQLRNHRKLDLIDIYMISMYSLDQELPSWPNLRHLGIGQAEISFIHPKAFRGLKSLVNINLDRNEIKEMKRSMFPDLAEDLYHIDLSNNLLETLPDDMFTKMPSLREVYLKYNKLTTLKEDTYLWPLQNLQTLDVTGNKFRCDCRMMWMVKKKKPLWFIGICDVPTALKDVNLNNLNEKNLYC